MMYRRALVVAGVSMFGLRSGWSQTTGSQLSNEDQSDLARIEAYLNGIRTLKAHFIQTAPDGGVTQGMAVMQRPGRMRFQYDPPSPFLLIANYGILFFHDAQLNQTSNMPLSRTPLGILLADKTTLSGNVSVTKFVRLPGQIQVSLVRTASPGEGTLTLTFADNPLALRQWTVLDQQGKQTRVSFTNMQVGASIDARLFDYSNVTSGAAGGG
jgi:outer membrane lipoprotein-sorting protein